MASVQWHVAKGYGAAIVLHLLLNGPTLVMADIPTFTMKADAYFGTPTALPEVEANDVSIVDGDGVDVTFGSDWSQRIRDAVDANCADGRSTTCQSEVEKVLGLGATEGGLQARMIPLLLLGGAALASIIASIYMISKGEVVAMDPVHFHLPQDQNDEVSKWDTTSGNFTMQPTEGDAFGVDMVGHEPTSSPPSDEIPSGTIAENGDLELTVGDLASAIDEAFGKALCPRGIGRRALSKRETIQCFVNKVRSFIRLVQEGGNLAAFQYIDPTDFKFPDPANDLLKDAYEQTQGFTDNMLMHPDTTEEVRQKVHDYANYIAFAESIGGYTFTDGKMTIKASFLEKQQPDEDEEDDSACPSEFEDIPICDKCGGNSEGPSDTYTSIGKCVGDTSQEQSYEGCDCIIATVFAESRDEAAEQVIISMLEAAVNGTGNNSTEPSEEKNKGVLIRIEQPNVEVEDYHWVFYEKEPCEGDGCSTYKSIAFVGPFFHDGNIVMPAHPSGVYDMTVWGRECQFKGSGENPGELICDDTHYPCIDPSEDVTAESDPNGTAQKDAAYCFLDSDGAASESGWTTGSCSIKIRQEFRYPKFDDHAVDVLVEIMDGSGKKIGNWGGEGAGTSVAEGDAVEATSNLPETVVFKGSRFDASKSQPIDNWKNSFDWNITYGTQQTWWSYDREPPMPDYYQSSCKEPKYVSVLDKGYSLTHECFFDC